MAVGGGRLFAAGLSLLKHVGSCTGCGGAGHGDHACFPSASALSHLEAFLRLVEGCEHSWGSLIDEGLLRYLGSQ